MNNRTLEIILKLRDELTAKMKGAEGALRRFQAQATTFANDLKRVSVVIGSLGRSMIGFGAVITGPLLLAFNSASKYSRGVNDELTRMKIVMDTFYISVAEAMVPIMHQFAEILGKLYQAWEGLGTKTQQAIIQGVLLTGVFITLGGTIFTVISQVGKAISNVIKIALSMNPMILAVMAVVAAIVLMIEHWDKVRSVALPVLNAIEIAANMVAIGFHKMISGMVDGMIVVSLKTAEFARALAQVPGPQQNVFLNAAAGLDTFAGKLRGASVAERQTIADLEKNIQKIFETGTGGMVNMADDLKKKWDELKNMWGGESGLNWKAMEDNLSAAQAKIKTWGDAVKSISEQTAGAMSNSFSTMFFDAFRGQLNSAKDYAAEFGTSVLQILSQVLAKLVLVNTIGTVFPGMAAFFHQGGVVKAHSGYLASDEVPIIAQAGEGIISKKGMANLGAYNLQRLNSGNAGSSNGGVNITIPVAVNLVSMADMERHQAEFSAIIGNTIRNNYEIRKIIQRYT